MSMCECKCVYLCTFVCGLLNKQKSKERCLVGRMGVTEIFRGKRNNLKMLLLKLIYLKLYIYVYENFSYRCNATKVY